MTAPAHVSGPHGLAEHAGDFAPGTTVIVDGRVSRVLGRIVATDHVETWLECLLEHDGEERWLAVEAPTGPVRYTLWRRDTAERAGLDPQDGTLHGVALTTTERGTATFSATGRFGRFAIPAAGCLEYVEFTHAGGRVAAARFDPGRPWLVGQGTGLPVAVRRP
ncbi:DUF4178 domain-containing protein [Actinoplanes sp. NPDC051494]|uniref:DUF4178 domain-containing protein n=1 Tax=Actinoplanes sp. NPDC051494 TaxID=3363907 RepID=UPI00379C3656